jgi:DNA-binding MarR family transcriptional regulator
MEFENHRHEALVSFWWTGVILGKCADKLFGRFDMSVAKFNLMMAVRYADGPLNQKELSERLLVDKSGLTGMIDRLAKQGLIERKCVPNDRRSYHIALTQAGCDMLESVIEVYDRLIDGITEDISDRQLPQVMKFSERIRAAALEQIEELSR